MSCTVQNVQTGHDFFCQTGSDFFPVKKCNHVYSMHVSCISNTIYICMWRNGIFHLPLYIVEWNIPFTSI